MLSDRDLEKRLKVLIDANRTLEIRSGLLGVGNSLESEFKRFSIVWYLNTNLQSMSSDATNANITFWESGKFEFRLGIGSCERLIRNSNYTHEKVKNQIN